MGRPGSCPDPGPPPLGVSMPATPAAVLPLLALAGIDGRGALDPTFTVPDGLNDTGLPVIPTAEGRALCIPPNASPRGARPITGLPERGPLLTDPDVGRAMVSNTLLWFALLST